MKTPLFLFVSLMSCFSLFGQGVKTHTVHFATNSAELTEIEKSSLTAFLDLFDKSKIEETKLVGHTDSDGEDDFNIRLSQNRSKTVEKFVRLQVVKGSIQEAFGESKPIKENLSDEGKAANRRVEVQIKYGKGGLLSENNYKVLAYRNLPTSEYCIDPTRDTVLNLTKGGRVIFQANTFANDWKCVTITAKEAYKKSEIILANLSTSSNGRVLESGGMMILEARNSDGKELQSQKEFIVQMPTTNFLDSMMIFNGDHDRDSNLNWILPQQTDWNSFIEPRGVCFDTLGRPIPIFVPKSCDECKFFPCRVKRIGAFFGGAVDVGQRKSNRELRQCQRKLRKQRKSGAKPADPTNAWVNEKQWKICEDLQRFMDSLGLKNYKEYQDYVLEQRRIEFEGRLKAGKATVNEVTMYTMRSNRMGLINCDRFYKMPANEKVATFVLADDNEDELKNTQCSIVLDDRKSVIASKRDGKKFVFIDLPKQMSFFVLAVMMRQGKIFLSSEKTENQGSLPAFKYREVSFEELQEELQKLD